MSDMAHIIIERKTMKKRTVAKGLAPVPPCTFLDKP